MPSITKMVLLRPYNGTKSNTMTLEAEFATHANHSGARLTLSAAMPDNPKLTIEDLYKRSYDILYDILRESSQPPAPVETGQH